MNSRRGPAAPTKTKWQRRAEYASSLPLLVPRSDRVGYIGWLGHANVGDEAMFEAIRDAASDFRVTAMPETHILRRVISVAPRPPVAGMSLGGGTLIGHAGYRRQFEHLWARFPNVPSFILGAGVEDPELDRLGVPSDERSDELREWGRLLPRFARVGVRGPRSAALLADVGATVDVVGDSALLLGPAARRAPQRGLVGINAGYAPVQWGHDPARVTREFTGLVDNLHRRGFRVRLISMMPRDLETLDEIRQRANAPVEIVRTTNVSASLDSIAECQLFIGLKLHSVILASAVDVPSVMVEYQPKGRDFMESIGRARWILRTDQFSSAAALDLLEELERNEPAEREKVRTACDALRERWPGFLADVRDALGSRP